MTGWMSGAKPVPDETIYWFTSRMRSISSRLFRHRCRRRPGPQEWFSSGVGFLAVSLVWFSGLPSASASHFVDRTGPSV
jgi:hypothetical protein